MPFAITWLAVSGLVMLRITAEWVFPTGSFLFSQAILLTWRPGCRDIFCFWIVLMACGSLVSMPLSGTLCTSTEYICWLGLTSLPSPEVQSWSFSSSVLVFGSGTKILTSPLGSFLAARTFLQAKPLPAWIFWMIASLESKATSCLSYCLGKCRVSSVVMGGVGGFGGVRATICDHFGVVGWIGTLMAFLTS